MTKVFINLTERAEAAGLKFTVSISHDMQDTRYSFTNGTDEVFECLIEAARWLDGYSRGMAVERVNSVRNGGNC